MWKYGVISGPYFPVFWLNAEIYSLFGDFSRSDTSHARCKFWSHLNYFHFLQRKNCGFFHLMFKNSKFAKFKTIQLFGSYSINSEENLQPLTDRQANLIKLVWYIFQMKDYSTKFDVHTIKLITQRIPSFFLSVKFL